MPKTEDGFDVLHDYTADASGNVGMTPDRFQANLEDIAAYLGDVLTESEVNALIEDLNDTDLTVTVTDNTVTLHSSTGADVVLPLASDLKAGLLSKEDKAKIDTIAESADDNTQVMQDIAANAADILANAAAATSAANAAAANAQELADRVPVGNAGQANGAATLGSNSELAETQIPSGLIRSKGDWDAATNTPELSDGSGTFGDWHRVSEEGATSLDGIATWLRDDIVWRDENVWRRIGSSAGAVSSSISITDDASVGGFGQTNVHGGSKWRAHWTRDQRAIVIYGDQSELGFDPAGDSWGPFVVPWDAATNGNITAMYAGINYLLILTDLATGNLFHMGATDDGQGGRGATSGTTLVPARITQFVTDSVKIVSVKTEANVGNTEKFWFAITTTGLLYSCGYSGATHTMGYNNTSDISTPRKMTYSDGTTEIANVAEVSCCTAYAPVWARLTTGVALRWGAGTDGAHGNNGTTVMTWPDALETSHGSGVDRTDIAQVVTVGAAVTVTRAASWLLTTAGKIECAGAHNNGIGDGAALGATDAVTFQTAAGTIDTLTVTSIHGGGGSTPICAAITSAGNGYIVGYVEDGLIGDGSTSNVSSFTALSGLPSGFGAALTNIRIAGGFSTNARQTIYLEATISGSKRIASIGYGGSYATATGSADISEASRTWVEIVGAFAAVQSWQSVGQAVEYGIELIDVDGRLWYAGGNDQGQGGVQVGNLHSVPYMQPCMLSGDRVAKAPTHRGIYSAVTEYSYNDEVTQSGSTWRYINATATTGNAPPTLPTTSNTYWLLSAQKGDAGYANILFDFDGGSGALAAGTVVRIPISFDCTIEEATLIADQSGSAVVDVWKDVFANYPPTVADTITASAKPTLSAATTAQDGTLTGWTTSIAAGDVLVAYLESVSGIVNLILNLKVQRS